VVNIDYHGVDLWADSDVLSAGVPISAAFGYQRQ